MRARKHAHARTRASAQVRLEKYGRVLCDVSLRGVNASDWMLQRRLAVPYDGGKKEAVDWAGRGY
eukprot:6209213-Pleurochrysis_carterae.AAC.1